MSMERQPGGNGCAAGGRMAQMTAMARQNASTWAADVRPIGGRIGATVENVHLSGDLPEEAISEIEHLLQRHKVLFFPGQTHLDDAGQEAFGARFGAPFAHPTQGALKGTSSVLDLDTRRSGEPDKGQAGGARADQWH